MIPFQIFCTLEPTWQQLLLENLCKSPIWKALISNYLKLVVSMDNSPSRQKCTEVKMEPYFDTCYNQSNTNTMCDLANALLYCQTDFADTTHNVKANLCTADTYGNYIDKKRYKTIRKWKRIEKGKSHSFLFKHYIFFKWMYNI